jgi:hypothetical protein
MLTVIALVVAALGPAVAASPAEGSYRLIDCGDVDGPGVGIKNVTTRGVGCSTARRAARAYEYRDQRPSGYACRRRKIEQYVYDVRCTRGQRVMRWQFASD